jgi:hypothetical protein
MNARETAAYLKSLNIRMRRSRNRWARWITTDRHTGTSEQGFESLAHLWRYWESQAADVLVNAALAERIAVELPTMRTRDAVAVRAWVFEDSAPAPHVLLTLRTDVETTFRLPRDWRSRFATHVAEHGSFINPGIYRLLRRARLQPT